MEEITIVDCDCKDSLYYELFYTRAALIDKNNVLVERHLDGSILLPGTIYVNSDLEHIMSHLKYKLGVNYNADELSKIFLVNHFQGDIPFDDSFVFRKAITSYFLGKYKGIDFTLARDIDCSSFKFMDIDELIEMTSIKSKNEVVDSNNRETNKVLKLLKKVE